MNNENKKWDETPELSKLLLAYSQAKYRVMEEDAPNEEMKLAIRNIRNFVSQVEKSASQSAYDKAIEIVAREMDNPSNYHDTDSFKKAILEINKLKNK